MFRIVLCFLLLFFWPINNRHLFLTVLEPERPKIRHQSGHGLVPIWHHRCILMWGKGSGLYQASFFIYSFPLSFKNKTFHYLHSEAVEENNNKEKKYHFYKELLVQ